MELRHLRYFVAVAEELHFGRAAERLFMAQPPLSQQIKQLEVELGFDLFERTNRRVRLTEAGKVYLEEARVILRRVEDAKVKAFRVSRGETGWIGVGFVASSSYDILPDVLRRFRDLYPDVELVLAELLSIDQIGALREKRIHVGFSRMSIVERGIVCETIATERLLVALPSRHPLAGASSIRVRDLEGQPFIQFPKASESSYYQVIEGLCSAEGFAPSVIQKTDEVQTAISLVVAGLGITIVPEPIQNLLRDGIVYRPFIEPSPVVNLAMAYREDETSPVLPRFLEVARQLATG